MHFRFSQYYITMTMQQYCLRWNNHQPNFISVFSSLLNSESLVDVTLAAEGRHLQAHKVVLSACSSYFQVYIKYKHNKFITYYSTTQALIWCIFIRFLLFRFQSLFTVNPCQHPIVILKDVKFADLKVMVDFMYYGEVNVSQEQLPYILKTAEMLKIKGNTNQFHILWNNNHFLLQFRLSWNACWSIYYKTK